MAAASLARISAAACLVRGRTCSAHPLGALAPGSTFLRGVTSLRQQASVATSAAPARRRLSVITFREGERLPSGEFTLLDKEGNKQSVSLDSLTRGKKVVLFGVPGAFTPTCSSKHLPGFIEHADEIRAKGVDTIACVSVNDPFVMKAWGESAGAAGKVLMLADPFAQFTEALGVTLDMSDKALGTRSKRYSLLVEDGVIKAFNLEEGGGLTSSGADGILKAL